MLMDTNLKFALGAVVGSLGMIVVLASFIF
ncbi:YnhF family membrane protein [Ferrimonas sediminicola]|uniref:YnhF family membrane protein n=1 Tax=Ferrimonas sediminicola TaxID=2569538 RepID=A0A4U1BC66_9GAMM|nr:MULTISPECIES: YnhF family membrane protein [Ferrimonas]TKB48551.1 YnhF family membrane protein [Ferrimonas sediminicola]BDY05356.1 hypothetical protein F0521_23970 [Ferrimonas sp. YFM]